ncbi:hypothetical protein R1sor_014121 [Riccia sorocarpa]|uniref:Endonuclease/exonuclease/phosphatase domain-containing protein n=1 Tax=Riccia sorocarpa TaxID=122646 RepID=A0ABD3H8H0_9MARC
MDATDQVEPIEETEESRVRRMLEELFGPEVEDTSDTSETGESGETLDTTNWPPATALAPEDLYGHLEREGILRPPLTIDRLVGIGDYGPRFDPYFWGVWRTKQATLVRDHSSADRIKYKAVFSKIEDDSGLDEVFVSRIWSGTEVPPFVGFGALLEGRDGVYRAGLDIGRGGFLHSTDPAERAFQTVTARDDGVQTVDSRLDIQPILTGFKNKLRTYAEVTRESQLAVLREHEEARRLELEARFRSFTDAAQESQAVLQTERDKELMARHERSLNIRVVGLVEQEDEDTKILVTDFFRNTLKIHNPGVVHAFRVGKGERGPKPVVVRFNSLESRTTILSGRGMLKGENIWLDADLTPAQAETSWSHADIIGLAETWSRHEAVNVELDGFCCLISLWNDKKHQKGRGFGGIAVWVRESLDVKVEYTDVKKQFVCLSIMRGSLVSFFIFAYFAPLGAPIYQLKPIRLDPFEEISRIVTNFQQKGPVWIFGDFNSRIGSLQPGEDVDVGPQWRDDCNSDWNRSSDDAGRNPMGELFLRFLTTCSLTILNGSSKFPNTQACTFVGAMGSSTVDFVLATYSAQDEVSTFALGPIVPESDHRALHCNIKIPRTHNRTVRRPVNYIMLREKRAVYEQKITEELAKGVGGSDDVTSTLLKAARDVNMGCSTGRRAWYDVACMEARKTALEASGDARHVAFRTYKHFVRAKRRYFIREEQRRLEEELKLEPRIFWSRLRPPGSVSTLPREQLLDHVKTLYFVPETAVMPVHGGPAIEFSLEEVDNELNHINTGRAADLSGLHIEMLRWGDLTPVLEHMDVKMQSCAEATRVAHTTLLQEQEKEKLAREARINNLRIVGLPEEDKENTKDVVLKFFQEELLVREPIVESAVRIGRGERGSRAILVRFGSAERRGRVVGNRRLLK